MIHHRVENLGWATAQIHCYCIVSDEDKTLDATNTKSNQKTNLLYGATETALSTQQGQGNVVLETEPRILFCDLRLSPGETKSCNFHELSRILVLFYNLMLYCSLSYRSLQGNTSDVWTTNISWH